MIAEIHIHTYIQCDIQFQEFPKFPKFFLSDYEISSLLLLLTRHICVKMRSRFEAKSIAIAKSARSIVIARIIHGRPVLDVSLTPLPPESTPCNAGHGRKNSDCLFWTGFLGLHYTWVKAGLQDLAISDSKVARPL